MTTPGVRPFLAWTAVGAAFSLAVASLLSIGIFVLPVAIVGLALLLSRQASRNGSAAGAVCGLGIVPLYVAYLNRSGPGDVCTSIAGGGQECTQEWTPWPFLASGLLLVAGGLALFWWLRRRAVRGQATEQVAS
ncbi:MAG TPA: hypothetical protein VF834_10655 [Streptosporangiaceae bacterium]